MANTEYNLGLGVKVLDTNIQQQIDNISKTLKDLNIKVDSKDIEKLSVVFSEVTKDSKKLQTINAQLKNEQGQILKITQSFDAETQQVLNSTTRLLQVRKSETQQLKEQAQLTKLQSDKIVLDNRISGYLNENSRLSDGLKNRLIDIQNQISKADKISLDRLKGEFREVTTEAKALNLTGKSALDELTDGFKKFSMWLGVGNIIISATRTVKDMVNSVVELNGNLVELQKVTDLTGDALERFVDKAYEMGSRVARTGQEVIQATTVFKRAGYTLEESFDLAEASLVMVNVGDGIRNVEEASSALIATLKGFKLSDTDAMSVIDMINETSNNAAIDFENITEGLRRVSGTLSQTGASIQETIGLLTGGFGSLRNIEMVSSGLIMISQRLRGIGEDGEAIDGLAPKLQKSFKEIANINIEDANGKLRNTYDILSDMARVFPTLTSEQQQYLGELAAGNRQVKVLNAIISGWEDVEQAVKSATNSQGSALIENEKVLSSIQGKANAVRSSFEQLSQNTIDSDWIKFFLDFSNILIKTVDNIGVFNIALLTMFGVIGSKTGLFSTLIGQIQMLILAQTGYTASTVKAALAQVGLTGAIKATTVALTTFMATNPIGWILGITAAIGGLFAIQDALTVSLEEQQAVTQKLQAEYQELETELSGLSSELETTAKRIDELNSKDALTIIEQDELSNLKDANAELETQIGLLKEQALLKSQEIAKSVAEEYAKDMLNNVNEKTYWTGRNNSYGYKEFITTNEEDYIKNMISLMQTYNSRKERGIELTKEESDYYTQIRKDLVSYGVELYDYADRYKIDDEVSQSWRDFGKLIDKTLNPDKYRQETFENIYSSDSFKKAKKELEALAKSGELSPETLSSNKEYQRLIIGTGYTAEQVAEHINALVKSTSNSLSDFPTSSFETLNKALDDLDKKSKDTVSSLGDLNQILYDQANGEKLTSEQVYKLITQFPQLASAIEKTSDGYTINAEAVDTVRNALIEQEKANATAQLNMTKNTLDGVRDRVEGYGIELEAITNIQTAMSEQGKLSLNKLFGTMEGWMFDDATKRVTTPTGSFIANATATEYDAIKKAYEEQKLIYDAVGKMGTLQERINGLQNDLLSGKDFGVKQGKTSEPEWLTNYNKKKSDIDHLLAIDKMTQSEYYNKLQKLNEESFGQHKDKYLDQYRKNVEAIYQGRKKIDEDAIKNAFNLGTTDSKGNKILGKNDLDYKLAMEEITQEEYLKGLEKINEATFGKHKDKYLEDYRKNEIEIDKGRKAIDKKIFEELIKSKFSDLDHDYAMGRIKTEEEYQTARWELAKEYYKNNKDYLNEWKKAQEEWHKWNIEQTEKELKETEKKRLNTIDKIISKYGELRDAINKTAEYQSGDEQVSTYLEGIKSANKEIKYIENEIKKLNKRKITNLFTQDDYDSQLKTLQSALSKARSSIEDFNKSIADSIKSSSKEVMDALEDNFKKMTEYWEGEKDAYSDIIKTQKDILNLKKEQNEYEKSIAKKTKEISKIESRMAELQKAAMTGDRQANAELQKLNEELADKKEDLSDTQADHEHDLANKALDKALDDNNKIVDAKLKAIKTEYETQRDNQQKLYDQLIELTSRASNYSIEAYSKAIDEIASKMAQNGIGLNADHITSLKNAQAQSYNNANSVYSILGNKSNANMSQDTSGLSGLNKYLASQGYSIVNKNKMVQLAQALGLYDINNPNMVGTDELGRLNKNRIMEALKRMFSGSTFAKGGIASLPKMLGEDGIAFVKNGEPILTVEQGKLFKELINNIKPLNNLVKLSTPNISNIVNNSSPTTINVTVPVTGSIDSRTATTFGNTVAQQVAKAIIDIKRAK